MRKTFLIALREFRAVVGTKAFLISVMAMPIFMGGGFFAIEFLKNKGGIEEKIIAVIDHSGKFIGPIQMAAAANNQLVEYLANASEEDAAILRYLENGDLLAQCNIVSLASRPADKPLLLDVREPWEYRIVHLEGSTLVPMRQIPQQAEALDPDRETVVICHHGIRSRQVARFLESRGFSNVINLAGGIDAWARNTDPELPVS